MSTTRRLRWALWGTVSEAQKHLKAFLNTQHGCALHTCTFIITWRSAHSR